MIRINGENYSNHNIINDNIVIDISNPGVPCDVTLKTLIDNHGEPTGNINITVFEVNGHTGEMFKLDTNTEYTPYDQYIGNEAISNLDDRFTNNDNTKKIKNAFDKFNRQYLGHEGDFIITENLTRNQMIICLSDALNIMPSLMFEEGLSCDEKIKYSQIGKDLMWNDFMEEATGKNGNPFPSLEDIKLYDLLNVYEKRIIRQRNIHPLYMLNQYKSLQELRPGQVLADPNIKGNRWNILDSEMHIAQIQGNFYLSPDLDDVVAIFESKLDAEFKEKMHRSPRVLHEIAMAMVSAGLNPQKKMEDIAEEYVKKFSVPAMQKIAKYHSPALFAISNKLNFAEVSDEHIKIFASFLDIHKIYSLEKAKFFDWYNKHKNINANDLLSVITLDVLKEYKENFSVNDIIFELSQSKGREDAARMEQKYNYHFASNDLAIKGRDIVVSDDKYTILMLDPLDYRNFTIGYDTNCCQHCGGAGETCVYKLTSDPFAGAVVLLKNSQVKDGKWMTGDCIGQAFIWTDELKDTLVFDNMEFSRTGAENFDKKIDEFSDIIGVWAANMPYSNIHIGTGYNQGMNGWGIKVPFIAKMPKTVSDRHIYSDYHGDARSIKDGGVVKLSPKHVDKCNVLHVDVRESNFDKIKGFEWAIGITDSLTTDIEFIERWKENKTNDMMIQAFRHNPETIKFMDEPPLSIQQEVVALHSDLISYIKNPDPSIFNVLIANNPYTIFNIENPGKEAWKAAVHGNGLLLEKCPFDDIDIVNEALQNNGLAIKFVSSPTEEQQMLAVRQTKNAISFIKEPCSSAVLFATGDKSLVSNVQQTDENTLIRMIDERPASILSIKEPSLSLIERAVSKNGLLVKNFKRVSEEINLLAVKQNGFAIKYIPDPSREVYEEAYKQNPNSIKYFRLTPEEKQNIINGLEDRER